MRTPDDNRTPPSGQADPFGAQAAAAAAEPTYRARRVSTSRFETIRGLRYHLRVWGRLEDSAPARPPLVMVHGWMDVGASFQFVVDALAEAEGFERTVVAPDWRGFGLTASAPADSYWFPDYTGDLDALVDVIAPGGAPIDLLGHSMGGNVVMTYAGVRSARVRRLVNLEGFGMATTKPHHAPRRLAQWLDGLKTPERLRPYETLAAVAARLQSNDPLLPADKAAWLASHWAEQRSDGLWHLRADPAHKRINPMLYQAPEVLETWKLITAPLLWVDGDRTAHRWTERYTRAEFDARLAHVPDVRMRTLSPCGHMVHFDQPEALARELAAFLG
jgi:pimeloyl-ACP methyl ester carboxylesterase